MVEVRLGTLAEVASINETIKEWEICFSKSYIEKYLDGKEYIAVIGAVDNTPVGFSVCTLERPDSTLHRWISGVNSEFRGKGIYHSILSFYENWSRQEDLHKITSDVAKKRQLMITLNLKYGYTIVYTETGADDNSRIFFEKII